MDWKRGAPEAKFPLRSALIAIPLLGIVPLAALAVFVMLELGLWRSLVLFGGLLVVLLAASAFAAWHIDAKAAVSSDTSCRRASPTARPTRRIGAENHSRQSAHLGKTLDDLLDVGGAITGKVALRRQRIELGAVVRAAITHFEAPERAAGPRLTLDAEPAWVDADPARIEQIVVNLVGIFDLFAQAHAEPARPRRSRYRTYDHAAPRGAARRIDWRGEQGRDAARALPSGYRSRKLRNVTRLSMRPQNLAAKSSTSSSYRTTPMHAKLSPATSSSPEIPFARVLTVRRRSPRRRRACPTPRSSTSVSLANFSPRKSPRATVSSHRRKNRRQACCDD
jgi:hypothetical protein